MFGMRNKVQLIGNLGSRPEVKCAENGRKQATFRLATNESYMNDSGEKVVNTQWHRIVAWGKVADVAEKLLDKGREVAIEGKLITRDYIDRFGNRRLITEVQMTDLLLLGRRQS